jgi:hypothetical protein
MPVKKGEEMSRFYVEFDVANYRDLIAADLGALDRAKVRRARIRGLVDTGASELVLPAQVAKQLGLPKGRKRRVRYADGRRAIRDSAEDAYVEMSSCNVHGHR